MLSAAANILSGDLRCATSVSTISEPGLGLDLLDTPSLWNVRLVAQLVKLTSP